MMRNLSQRMSVRVRSHRKSLKKSFRFRHDDVGDDDDDEEEEDGSRAAAKALGSQLDEEGLQDDDQVRPGLNCLACFGGGGGRSRRSRRRWPTTTKSSS